MSEFRLALDSPSVREIDKNGFLHVDVSPVTKEQVVPYYGHEVPNWENLGLDPDKIYNAYRPAEELSKPETVKSLNGMPIQFKHNADFADSPAKDTRVGTTGTDAEFKAPYLVVSLHIFDKFAQDRINDGSMRELSLAYHYDPELKSGRFNGMPYDFIIRNIRVNHVALVEEGRAGHDVLVLDHSIKESKKMAKDEKVTTDSIKDAVERLEVLCAEIIQALHKEKPDGEIVDVFDEDFDAKEGVKYGEEIERDKLEREHEEGGEDEDFDAPEGVNYGEKIEREREEREEIPGGKDEDFDAEEGVKYGEEIERRKLEREHEAEDMLKDAIRACGFDAESPEVQKAFAEGVKYGERLEKSEPKKLDSEHESEGMKKALGEDQAFKLVKAHFQAIEDVKPTLGSVRFGAFDSAGAIYMAALKQEGARMKGVNKGNAREIYHAFVAGKKNAGRKSLASDSKIMKDNDVLSTFFKNVKID